jgi:serine/threonine protein kinase
MASFLKMLRGRLQAARTPRAKESTYQLVQTLRDRLAAKTPLPTDRTYQLVRCLRDTRDNVWIGHDDTVGKVILKLARSENLKTFEREVNLQIDFINSKHIRRILDVVTAPKEGLKRGFEAAMVLEYKHYSLWDACFDPKNAPMSDRQIDQVMKDVLHGLSDLHEQNVVHLG